MMTNNRGFTLIEILLAAMIVGLIGLSLGAISTAALRESGIGRTRMILRNQLSLALRQLRQDIHEASKITFPSSGNDMLVLEYNADQRIGQDPTNRHTVTYKLENSWISAPGGGTVGNKIMRIVKDSEGNVLFRSDTKPWLENVKSITSQTDLDEAYPSFKPLSSSGQDSRVIVRLIVQPVGEIVINETVRTVIVSPQGGYTTDPCLTNSAGCEL